MPRMIPGLQTCSVEVASSAPVVWGDVRAYRVLYLFESRKEMGAPFPVPTTERQSQALL